MGPAAIICGFFVLLSLVGFVVDLIDGEIGGSFSSIAVGLFFGLVGWFFSERRHKQGVVLTARHLVVRDGTGQAIEIHIEHARATLKPPSEALFRHL